MKSRIVWWISTVCCALLILGFSCQSVSSSKRLSGTITNAVLEQDDTYQDLTQEQQVIKKDSTHKKVRSIAHVMIFTPLAFCVSMLVCSYSIRYWALVAFPSCALFAVVDESVQYLMRAGRTFQFADLIKDWTGSLLGIAIAALILWIIARMHGEETGNGISGSGA